MDDKTHQVSTRRQQVPASRPIARGFRDDHLQRYARGEWATSVFVDMLRDEVIQLPVRETFLDIGCGSGIDREPTFHDELAEYCRQLIAVEPRDDVRPSAAVRRVHRSRFEDTSLPPKSVDLAWSFYVLEHIADPEQFFAKLLSVLRPGGVFWAFTRDARHYSARWSENTSENTQLPMQCNEPAQIANYVSKFKRMETYEFHRAGDVAHHFPRLTMPFWIAMDTCRSWAGLPGRMLAVRLER